MSTSATVTATEKPVSSGILLHLPPALPLSDDIFQELCRLNDTLRLERSETGDLFILPPTGGNTGNRNSVLHILLGGWFLSQGTGVTFDSSTGFRLPNGAIRSPDFAWVERSRWEALSETSRKKFPPLCPDFILELRSETDEIDALEEKMREYVENGAQLGWLIDPIERKVHLYRADRTVEILDSPATVTGEAGLTGFILPTGDLW